MPAEASREWRDEFAATRHAAYVSHAAVGPPEAGETARLLAQCGVTVAARPRRPWAGLDEIV